jgi:Ssp1 endopeptidase immunity protein Rap1a
MRTAILAMGALCCLAMSSTVAGVLRPTFFDAPKLEKACSNQTSALDVGVCFGYVLGVADVGETVQLANSKRLWCWPDDISVTVAMERSVDAVKAYMRKYPEDTKDWSGSAIVWEALKEHFPCT